MIKEISIDNFKCFDNTQIDLSNLTLFTGVNSGGKSSVIQALLLLSQTISSKNQSPLNGHLVSIGNFVEARNFETNAKDFRIGVASTNTSLAYKYIAKGDSYICHLKKNSDWLKNNLDYKNKHLHYLSANRIGAQDIYQNNLDQIDTYGIFGEYSIAFYEENKTKPLNRKLVKDRNSFTLQTQVNYWLKHIVNSELSTEDILGTDRIKASYTHGKSMRSIRPVNIGSGVSYIVSVIITCLSAKRNDIVVLENPEIHLHPKAQSKLTDFFVMVANYGIQLIIEL